jgi:hypothetical protein
MVTGVRILKQNVDFRYSGIRGILGVCVWGVIRRFITKLVTLSTKHETSASVVTIGGLAASTDCLSNTTSK